MFDRSTRYGTVWTLSTQYGCGWTGIIKQQRIMQTGNDTLNYYNLSDPASLLNFIQEGLHVRFIWFRYTSDSMLSGLYNNVTCKNLPQHSNHSNIAIHLERFSVVLYLSNIRYHFLTARISRQLLSYNVLYTPIAQHFQNTFE